MSRLLPTNRFSAALSGAAFTRVLGVSYASVAYALGVTGALGLSPSAATAQDAPAFETTEIAQGVFRFRWQAHVGMFVVGDDGVVAFDPINPDAAAAYADEIKRVVGDLPLRWIVYSHSDADHSSGGSVLSDAFGGGIPIVATEASVDDISERASENQALPTVTFERFMALDLGDKVVELHYFGPSHSDNMLVGYVPDVRVAFAVDFVNNDRVGFRNLPGWHFPAQNTAIRRMMGLGFETVVYGHGDVGDRDSMWRQARFYDALETAVRAAIADGLTADQAAERIRFPEFEHFGAYGDWFELNVRGAYQNISGG